MSTAPCRPAPYLADQTARLVDTAGNQLITFADSGMQLTLLDLGFPETRNAQTNRAGTDGVDDTTKYVGQRPIIAEVFLPTATAFTLRDQLAGLMHPRNKHYLYVNNGEWAAERRVVVRPKTFTCPMTRPVTAQLGWSAPGGVLEDADVSVLPLAPLSTAEAGLSSPLASPLAFPAGALPGQSQITIGGSAPVFLTADIYGPCTNPALFSAATQETLRFNLTLAAGDYLHVNMANRTAYLNGDPTQSRYGQLDFTVSSWWQLPDATTSLIGFYPDTVGPGSQAIVTWRALYL